MLNGDPPGPPAGARPAGHPRRLIAILAVIVVLAVGWPLASGAVSGNQPLAAGTVLRIGPDAAHQARFTVGPGWVLSQSDSNPKTNYLLQNGAVRMSVVYVWVVTRSEARDLWPGLRRLLRAGNSAARLGGPGPLVSSRGVAGQTGVVRQGSQAGQAVIYLSPGKTYAIELIALGPPGAAAGRAAARQVIGSLQFPAARR